MGGRLSASSSRGLALLFLAVVAPPAIALAWLGRQLLEQDRPVLMQRELQDHQIAAQDAIRSLEQSLADAERLPAAELPAGMARFKLSPNGVMAEPAGRVLWLPFRGGRLFHDRRLSLDQSLSCASCQIPERGFTNNRPVSAGDFGGCGTRNVPAIINRGYGRAFFWDCTSKRWRNRSFNPSRTPWRWT